MNTQSGGKEKRRVEGEGGLQSGDFFAVNLIGFSSSAKKTLRLACCSMCAETAALMGKKVGGSTGSILVKRLF